MELDRIATTDVIAYRGLPIAALVRSRQPSRLLRENDAHTHLRLSLRLRTGARALVPASPAPRANAAYGVINNILYAAGGTTTGYAAPTSVEGYDPVTNTWTADTPIPKHENDDEARCLGTGIWNGLADYPYAVKATDQGEPGRTRDTFEVTILTPDRTTVVARADARLAAGNVQAVPLSGVIKK